MTNPDPRSTQTAVLVWDAPVRIVHGLLVICFAGAFITSESERWRLLHITLGYTMGGLVAFRVLWGLMGTRYARFSEFVKGPAAVMHYFKSLAAARPQHFVGHNPAGALAVLALLGLTAMLVGSGYLIYNDLGGDWLAELHEGLGNGLLLLVAVHVTAVMVSGHLHRENLVKAMISGRKWLDPEQGIRSAWGWLAVLIVLVVLAYWWTQWSNFRAH